jgi:hypothetical protein
MRCRLGVDQGVVGKAQSLVDSSEHPQRNGILYLRYDAGIRAEPVGEIAVAGRVLELDGFLKMIMGASKIAEIPAGGAENAVRHQDLGAIRPGRGFAQEELGHFAERCGFAATKVPRQKTVIRGEPLRGVFHLTR